MTTARGERRRFFPLSLVRERVGVRVISCAALILAAAITPARAGERWEGLRALPRVAVEVIVSPNHPDLPPDELRRHVEDALRQMHPAPAIDSTSPDRLRLTVGVRAYSSSDLRGYYLPLSQTYAIGPVRLSVERPGAVGGASMAVVVWQAERQVATPWRRSEVDILQLTDELVAVFLADYRSALGP